MLVIISDLHLTDGTSTASVAEESFESLGQRIEELAWRGSWRTDDRYRPLERIDLLLLGDTLDLLHTDAWLEADARPWSDPASSSLPATVERITRDILNQNMRGLETLRSLAAGGLVGLPPATRDGAPATSHERIPLTVDVHYLVGDHDWLLHLPGTPYDAIRAMVAEHLGLCTPADAPFPHDPLEDESLLQVLRRHRVMARHGDQFDPLGFHGHRDQASLNDAIAIQLIGRFRRELATRIGSELPPALAASLAQLEHLRPVTILTAWLESVLDRSETPVSIRQQVRRIWERMVEEFLEMEPVRAALSQREQPLLDTLARAFRAPTLDAARRLATAADEHGLLPGLGDSYVEHALREQDFRNRRAKHVVYGHSHRREARALDASSADGFVLNQMYFNGGTWRPSFERTAWSDRVWEFVPVEHVNLLAFFQGDERGGRTFEICSHSLAPRPAQVVERRLDIPMRSAASRTAPSVGRPHFRSGQTGIRTEAPARNGGAPGAPIAPRDDSARQLEITADGAAPRRLW